MKATFCAYDRRDYVGGPNAWLRRLLPELRLRGVEPSVLFVTHDDSGNCPAVRELRLKDVDCRCVRVEKVPYTEDRARWILERLKEDPPDVFVPNLMVAGYYAARRAVEAGIPSVGVMHSDDNFHYGLLDEFAQGNDEFRLSCVVCVSNYLADNVLIRKPESIVIKKIPYGSYIPKNPASPPGDKLGLVYTGRLEEEQKRASDVALALCRAVREVPGVEAVLYGDGPSKEAVQNIIGTEGKGLPVYLGGNVDSGAIYEKLLENHAIVLLSDYEGLPVSLMEGMACGLVPVCLKTRSGIPELVEDNVTGILVDDRGDSFVEAVRRLREEDGLWERLSAAAREKIKKEYSVEVCAEKWVELFSRLKEDSGNARAVEIPGRITLAPVNPSLAGEDKRRPPLFKLPFRKARRLAGKIWRRYFQTEGSPWEQPGERLFPSVFNPGFYHLKLLKNAVLDMAEKHFPKGGGLVLVDYGCGRMPYRRALEKYASRYIGADVGANPHADCYCDSLGRTPLPDACADAVISTQVLEHVDSPAGYLGECRRILKPGGVLLLSTHGIWRYHPNPSDLWRWTGEGLRRTVSGSGFDIVDSRGLMGAASAGVYLVQDEFIPRIFFLFRPAFTLFMQMLSILLDRMTSESARADNACAHIIAALRKDEA